MEIIYLLIFLGCIFKAFTNERIIDIWLLLSLASLGLLVYTLGINLTEFMDNFNI